jgi:transcription antitermination factor NusG
MVKFHQGWLVLYVRYRHEIKVNQKLKENGLETFLPLVPVVRTWKDRKKLIHTPLFPSYIFVKVQNAKDLYKCLDVKGACCFIKVGKRYANILPDEISKIKLLLGSEEVVKIDVSSKSIKKGEKRTITIGSLRGLECEILGLNGKVRVLIRIEALDKNITADIPIAYLN